MWSCTIRFDIDEDMDAFEQFINLKEGFSDIDENTIVLSSRAMRRTEKF